MWAIGRVRVLATAGLLCGCGDAPAPPADAPPPPPSIDGSLGVGKVSPTPTTSLGFGRKAFEMLRDEDWDGYTNLLVTRADMIAVFAEVDRNTSRKRRGRRRKVWRRVNRLRNEEAEAGWSATRTASRDQGVDWSAATLVDVRSSPATKVRQLPPKTERTALTIVIAHAGAEYAIDLGTCIRTKRGWVTTRPLQWQGPVVEPQPGTSLMHGDAPADAPP